MDAPFLRKPLNLLKNGGEGGIRTHVPHLWDNPISSRARYGQLRYLSASYDGDLALRVSCGRLPVKQEPHSREFPQAWQGVSAGNAAALAARERRQKTGAGEFGRGADG